MYNHKNQFCIIYLRCVINLHCSHCRQLLLLILTAVHKHVRHYFNYLPLFVVAMHNVTVRSIAVGYTWNVFIYQTYFALQHGGVYLVTTDREFSDVTAPYL